MTQKHRPHPSGRPIRRRPYGIVSRENPPRTEPLTPRLQEKNNPNAIGFWTKAYQDEDDL